MQIKEVRNEKKKEKNVNETTLNWAHFLIFAVYLKLGTSFHHLEDITLLLIHDEPLVGVRSVHISLCCLLEGITPISLLFFSFLLQHHQLHLVAVGFCSTRKTLVIVWLPIRIASNEREKNSHKLVNRASNAEACHYRSFLKRPLKTFLGWKWMAWKNMEQDTSWNYQIELQ